MNPQAVVAGNGVVMRMVVDSNYLQSEELVVFLESSKNNIAVLTDYAAMEAYKGNSIESITKSMEILCRYPDQVIVLKGTKKICGLTGRSKGLVGRLIDEKQTKEFGSFAKGIMATSKGSRQYYRTILSHGTEATKHIDKMQNEAVGIPEGVLMLEKCFTKDEKEILRKRVQMPDELKKKVVAHIFNISSNFFSHFPNHKQSQKLEEVFNTYIFRYATAGYVLAIRWITMGGIGGVKPERLRNDVVDLSYVTYATFFDGILTKDTRALDIYSDTKELLRQFGV